MAQNSKYDEDYRALTEDFKREIIASLRNDFNVTKVLDYLKISFKDYTAALLDPKFLEEVEWARKEAFQRLEDKTLDRATNGYQQEVYQKGSKVGTKTVIVPTESKTHLTAFDPNKYGNKVVVSPAGKGGFQIEVPHIPPKPVDAEKKELLVDERFSRE